ncbi:hypothetical protein HanPI659440_Chr02g0042081 [Helianthus annuus]|nr:hypothetical protein HanPI659440_Chr02g0042081 [Helianthus annuus]
MRLPWVETSAYKRESPPTPMISLLIVMPKSKRGRPPLMLRLTVFFVCRFRPKSYLSDGILDLPPAILLLF